MHLVSFWKTCTRCENWEPDTLPPDTLPLDQYRQRRLTANTLPPARHWQHRQDSCRVCFSPTSQSLVEPRGGTTLTCIQKAFAPLAVAARWHRHHMSLAVHWSNGIAYDLVLATSDWVSHHTGALLFISLTASIKLCFITCGQTPLLFRPQRHFSFV